MKFSEKWLREWVDPAITSTELVEQLTMAGLEVESIEPVAGDFSGVVVAEVLQAEQHPNADKLRVCQVSDGNEQFGIVCGAPNARAGIKVALAKVGAVLPENFKIKKAKLRGVESQGMLCSEAEIGLGEGADGIIELAPDAPVGADLREYLSLDDSCIDVDLTPNRGDCLGITGLAREVAVLNKLPLSRPGMPAVAPVVDDTFPVTVEAVEDCPRFVGRVIKNINLQATTPLWMVERLRRAGVRSIDPVVDVTNYILQELGQPMHAYDLDQLTDGIQVRRAKTGESLVLLDGQEAKLDEQVLLICDGSGPIGMAGIMGGQGTGVSASTGHIFLEAAYFNPLTIAGRARGYGLHTDASHRFERGVDFELQNAAIERATALLLEIVGGEPGPVTEVVSEADLPARPQIRLRKERIKLMLSLELADTEIEDILSRLGLGVESDESGWLVQIPSYRFDLAIEADLIEEIARIYGYNRMPLSKPRAFLAPTENAEAQLPLSTMKQVLVERGYSEAITYSFVDPALQSHFLDNNNPVVLSNPISSDMSDMRTSLWPGLVQALQYNQNRQQNRIRLFESGLVFSQTAEKIEQVRRIGGVITGARHQESWTAQRSSVDFYDAKGDVEALLALGACEDAYQFVPGNHPALHPGQTSEVIRDDSSVGYVGALHPTIERSLGLSGPIFLFELDLQILEQSRIPAFTELSKFPEVRRDLAIIVDKSIQLATIIKVVREAAGELLTDVRLFDVYQGQGIDPERKSLALGLTWQHRSRTLTDEEVSQWVDSIIKDLEKQFNADLRG